jgi:parallel beta-helix repeat protein
MMAVVFIHTPVHRRDRYQPQNPQQHRAERHWSKGRSRGLFYEPFGKAAGIYLDENANNIEISGNTVANGDWAGIFLHYAHTNNIHDNVFYNHRNAVLVSQFTPTTRNMLMTGNHFIARQASQNTFYYHTTTQDSPADMGLFNHNYYIRPLDDNNTLQVDNFFTGGNGTSYLSLAQWKALYKLDTLSLKSPVTFTTNSSDNFRLSTTPLPVQKPSALMPLTSMPPTSCIRVMLPCRHFHRLCC